MTRRVSQDITYRDLYSSIDNIWSALFMTGYLTCREGYNSGDCELKLVVPNREIRAVWQDLFIDRFERCHSDSAEAVRKIWIKHANKL